MPKSARTGAKSVRTRAHDAVIAVLVAARHEAALTQRQLADRLPAWLGWIHTTVSKAEKGRRDMSFVEVREYGKAVGVDVATVDKRAAELAAGRSGLRTRRPKEGSAPRKRGAQRATKR